MPVCKFCSKTLIRITSHEKTCRSNPCRIPGKNQYTNGGTCSKETREKIKRATTGKIPTMETRQKISQSRIAYLKENPDKVPYLLNHYSKGESYPEKYWRQLLENEGIVLQQEVQVGIYRLDFVINHLNIEIDGEQHYLDLRILASNKRRDEELTASGWKVLRIRWADYQKMERQNRELFVEHVLQLCRNS